LAITENKNKVSSLAKDFGMQSKDIIAILKDYTEAPKGHSQVLSDRELSIVFDYLTLHHQVKIETIFAETYTEKKEEPKAPQAFSTMSMMACAPLPLELAMAKAISERTSTSTRPTSSVSFSLAPLRKKGL